MAIENPVFSLMSSSDFAMENGWGGGSGISEFSQNPLLKQQWRKQSMWLQMQNHDVPPLKYASNAAINDRNQVPVQFYQSIAAIIDKEKAELEQYINLQNERLKWVLQEHLNQHFTSLLKKVELKTMILLRQKEEEITMAARKRIELEEFLRKLETENQLWQRVALENEAMIISLRNSLDQLRQATPCCIQTDAAEDAESRCDVTGDGGATKMAMICVVCNSRKSRLLFLPCRHLCSCKVCETGLDSCPVCGTGKKGSIEALNF